ncbi:MAG TPA: hypothetical protein VF253_13295 [Candidatus Limnocylindrales bacterium]
MTKHVEGGRGHPFRGDIHAWMALERALEQAARRARGLVAEKHVPGGARPPFGLALRAGIRHDHGAPERVGQMHRQ